MRDKCFGRGFDSHHLHQYKIILVIYNYIVYYINVYYINVNNIKIAMLMVTATLIITCAAEDNSDIIAEYGTVATWWKAILFPGM